MLSIKFKKIIFTVIISLFLCNIYSAPVSGNSKNTYEEHQELILEQIEISKEEKAQFQEAIELGFKDMESAFIETTIETKKTNRVIAFAVIGMGFILLIIVVLIIVITQLGFKQQQFQQEQYIQAFKILANNQNQTNRLILGGVTDIYGKSSLKLAGSSTWAPAKSLPEIEFNSEDEEALKKIAIKCEEIGARIDAATGRKNNSKNVSELVYKLSLQLGLSPEMSMVNFCAAMIYDAGFLGIDPDLLSIVNLNKEEKEAMKEHVALADKYLNFVPKKFWDVFSDAAMKHHENLDGTGYPNGLKGDEVPQIARLIRVAESFISISSKRSYRAPMDKESAVLKLKEQPQFYDQEVVAALDKIV